MSDGALSMPTREAGFRPSLVASLLASAILLVWFLSAITLNQPLLDSQRSRLLLTIGAVNGDLLRSDGLWRLVASQFLHVHFLHMLFNALCVLAIGSVIEKGYGRATLILVYFIGGSIGQAASVITYPELVSSGASQALMALCGAGLVMPSARRAKLAITAIVVIQVGLDIRASQTIKAGHWAGFLAGLALGAAVLWYFNRVSSARDHHVA